MIIDERPNMISQVFPRANAAGAFSINWIYHSIPPQSGMRLVGFALVFCYPLENRTKSLRVLKNLSDEEIRQLLSRPAFWLPEQYCQGENLRIWIAPSQVNSFDIHGNLMTAPTKIEVWMILSDAEGKFHLLEKNSTPFIRPLELASSITMEEFVPAETGCFGKVKKPAVKGVRIRVTCPGSVEGYEDGALLYRYRYDDSSIFYPLSKASLNRNLDFVSTEGRNYLPGDFVVQVHEDYKNLYLLKAR